MIQMLDEANAELRRLFSYGDFESAMRLNADCLSFVVQVDEYIKELAGRGTQTTELLKEYRDILTKTDAETGDEAAADNLRKKLDTVKASAISELKPDKTEVVFFPYKASMWDSLESVWYAAQRDPQCDAYVVPIPYYERLPNGTQGQMVYEGGDYPDYVPVVDWHEYDISERHPDVVFIHNPYDDGNYVTSVHPAYYSRRLKDLTDMLCYIPYFVFSGEVQDEFCTTEACVHAHRIFVQSELVRDGYIKAYSEAFGGEYGKPEDKFIALGSPKFDKISIAGVQNHELPDAWIRMIERPDGTCKRTVLYNTVISSILTGAEKHLDELREVLETFKKHDDIVLWWRPHPLSAPTYKSMLQYLHLEYEQIVAQYKQEGWGIYDDTPELHRAIAVTHAYFGDWSSLVAMYQQTGKPVRIAGYDYDEPFDDFLDYLASKSFEPQKIYSSSATSTENYGKRIYDYVRNGK